MKKAVEEIGVGVIGCGAMGMSVVRRVLALDGRVRVKALFDPNAESVGKALEELPETPVVCRSVDELLAGPDISWVMIASWNSFHCEQTLAAFGAGKHVFCQKPLAISLSECLEMYRAWRRTGLTFNIGFTLRYSPHYRKIKELIDSGAIGRIVSMEFNETLEFNHGGYIMGDWRRLRRNAGTHLLEKCSHDIDLANWMVGSRAIRVASFGGLNFFTSENAGRIQDVGRSPEGKEAYRAWPGLIGLNPFTSDKDIVDNQVVIIEYGNGVHATFHTNCNSALPERRMYILGSEGAIRADVLTGTIHLKRIGFDSRLEDHSTDAGGGHGDGDAYLARELVDSMRNGSAPAAGMKEGLESSVVCFAIDEALDTGRVVSLESYWEQVEECEKETPERELAVAC
jgi:Predicted dehydrogenases and related proteins